MTEQERKVLEELSALFDECIGDEVYKKRPKRYDIFYINMENVLDYEYTYVLAYELSQRNEKVKKHFERAKQYKENLEEYFDTLNLTDFYRDSINLGYGGFLEESNKSSEDDSFFEIDDSNVTLNDIKIFDFDLDVEHIGLWKLISYLVDTQNLYICSKQGYDARNDLKVQYFEPIDTDEAEKRIDDIMQTPWKYATYCKDKKSGEQKLTALSKDMPLEILDKDFLQDLNIIRTVYKLPQAKISYSAPTLKFKNEKVVNIPVNLNLSKKELIAYISKIKDDFDTNKSIVQSPLEIFGEFLIDAKEPKSQKKKNISKKDFADAIYIYDLYKYIENIYEKKLKKDDDYTKLTLHIEVSLACGISDVHNQYLRSGKVAKSKNKKHLELSKSDKIEKVYKLMREYIEDEKYKELIAGSEAIEITGMWDRIPSIPIFSITEDELNAKKDAYVKEI